MDEWKKDARRDVVFVDIDELVPQDHLLRKIERVMDYDWLYERLDPYYCHDNGRPGTDPVVLIKMVLIQHLFGIPSLRQTYQRIQDTISYRWFLGYGLLDKIPPFATVSYAFCNRFPPELTEEIFEHILNKAVNNRMVDPSTIFIDGTHIKASANKKKYQKALVKKAAKIYDDQLRKEINAEREKLGKKPINDNDKNEDDDSGDGDTVLKTVSTTDPESGLFVKGEHERQFAFEAHTACDSNGMILGVEVTAGNIHDSVAWDSVYKRVISMFPQVEFVTMDAGYKTPWIAKKILDDGRIPILPYTNHHNQKNYKPWEYIYDPKEDTFTCPHGGVLRHTTTSKDGKRTYRSNVKCCKDCPYKASCGANEKGQKVLQTHIWQEYLDLVEQLRKTKRGKEIYARRKETIERVFADAKEKHAMRYTHHRGLTRVTNWVRLKYAAMNLKKIAIWSWKSSFFRLICSKFHYIYVQNPAFV
jgi:transposase